MNAYDRQKAIEAVLYILNVTQGLDYYKVFKVLYFAEREHLKEWGTRILADDFVAMKYSPVPTNLYNAAKQDQYDDESSTFSSLFDSVIGLYNADGSNFLYSKREADLDYLAPSDIECLDRAIKEYSKRSFSELLNLSHDSAWEEAPHLGTLKPEEMARAAGAHEDIVEYVREQEPIDNALS